MRCLQIQGGDPIRGSVVISGNKNAALPMIAAAMLSEEEIILHNVPDILDVRNMLAIAEALGAESKFQNGSLRLRAGSRFSSEPSLPADLCARIRASLLFAGPLAARYGSARVFPPGGDVIGRRRLDGHFYGLRKLGLEMREEDKCFHFSRQRKLQGADIFLDEASVTATEHIMMTACLAPGSTIIRNAACEPHVTQLAELLKAMGAQISGLDTNQLRIEGVKQLGGAEITLEGDHIEAASYLSLCAACGGQLTLTGKLPPRHYWMTRRIFERFGLNLILRPNLLTLESNSNLQIVPDFGNAIPVIADGPWPQFPSDMLSCLVTVATQARGTVLFFEKMFESRLYFVDKLISMGANIVVCDPHRVVVSGPARLSGCEIPSPDIRAGMALVIAACCAQGESILKNTAMLERGYSNLAANLRSLGCRVQEIEK